MSLPWFRMYSEFASDPVIQALAFEDQRHYVVLLCLKCNGTLDRDISTANRNRIIYRGLGLDPGTAEEAKRRLCEMALIDDNWNPSGWEKRQFKSDISTKRVRNLRKTKRTGNGKEPLQNRFGNGPDTDTETDTEIPLKPPAGGPPPCPIQDIVKAYHDALPASPHIRVLAPTVEKALRTRWREEPERQTVEWWVEFFGYVATQCPFLVGQTHATDRPPFVADLGWLVKPANFAKVVNGNYERRRNAV